MQSYQNAPVCIALMHLWRNQVCEFIKDQSFSSYFLHLSDSINQRPDQYKMKILVRIQYPVWFSNTEVSVFNLKNTESVSVCGVNWSISIQYQYPHRKEGCKKE